jgi:hypothetical protein
VSTTEAGRHTASGKPDSPHRDGVSLQAVIEAARRLDELSCARVVASAAEAIHAAQRAGQTTGGVTPAAIVLRLDGSVQHVSGPASPRYTAPEKLRGAAGDRRADVFALGVVLWEALAHERLFDGATDDAIRQAVLGDAFRPPSELNANVPAELDAICKRALARDPADRYPSARVMAAEIDAVLGEAGYPESNEPIAAYVARALAVPEVIESDPSAREPAEPPPEPLGSDTASDTLPSLPLLPLEPAPAAETLTPLPSRVFEPAGPAAETLVPLPSRVLEPAGPAAETLVPSPPVLARKPSPERGVPSSTLPLPIATPRGKVARTEILGSLSSPQQPLAPSAFLAPPAGPPTRALSSTIPGTDAPPSGRPGTGAPSSPSGGSGREAPAFVMPQAHPVVLDAPVEATRQGPPFKPVSHPHPPIKSPIASAETLPTPHLPAQLPVQPPPQLDMPPGITVAPALPPARLRSTDLESGTGAPDHGPDPAAVVALPRSERPSTSRDVLAGWGWTTGSLQAIDDDEDHAAWAARAGRKRLLIAIGGAVGAVLVIALAAIAFGGRSDRDGEPATPRAAITPSAPTSATPPSPPPEPSAMPAEPSAAAAEPSAAPATEPQAPPAPGADPSSAAPVTPGPPAGPTGAAPAMPNTATPSANAMASSPSGQIAPAAASSPTPEPTRVAPSTTRQPKIAATRPETKPAPTRAEPARKVAKPELRKPERTVRRPPDDARPAFKAQPIDPYDTPADKPAFDPAEAYKVGLQRYARGDTAGALATFRASLSSDRTYAPTWRGLGLVYEKLGNKALARAAYKRYLELAKNAGDAGQIRERLERLGP